MGKNFPIFSVAVLEFAITLVLCIPKELGSEWSEILNYESIFHVVKALCFCSGSKIIFLFDDVEPLGIILQLDNNLSRLWSHQLASFAKEWFLLSTNAMGTLNVILGDVIFTSRTAAASMAN